MRTRSTFTMLVCALALGLNARVQAQENAPAPAAETPAGIQLNFKDATLGAVLQHLSETAGLTVVTDVSIEGRITVVGLKPLTEAEAVAVLNSALKEKGYAAIQMGRVLKVLPLDAAKKANVPVQSGSDPALIEATDKFVTQVIPLRSVDAAKLKKDLEPLIPSYASLSSNVSSNALILTDTEANVRRIVQIVSALDQRMSKALDVKVFVLKYADATNVAKVINEVFKVDDAASQQQQGQSGFMGRFFPGRGGAPNQQAQGEGKQQDKIRASADVPTNTVVVSGPPDTLEVVERVVKELDSDTTEKESVFIYHLKNADAANLEKVLTKLFTESTSSSARGGPTQTSGSAGRFATFMRGGSAQTSESGKATNLAGKVTVVADADSNSLSVMTAAKNFDRVREILTELDRPIRQVLIKVLIAEVTHSNAKDLGVEFSALNVRTSGRGPSVITDLDLAGQTDGIVFKLVEKDVNAAIRLLETVGRLDVLSRPYILTSDNKEATITVGQEVPFIRNTRTTETGQTINTIEYEDIGIILKVTPHINPDGIVIMTVSPEISTLTGRTVPISETVNAEVFAKRSSSSRVAIKNGQTIVIGGMMEDRKTENVRKVPLLGDIPLLGYLFRRTVIDKSKTELLIFLTPHVAEEAIALEPMSRDEEKGMKIVPKAVEPGVFDEHMEGMRRGASPKTAPKAGDRP